MNEITEKPEFISSFKNSIESGSFVKLTFGKYRGNEQDLEKIYVTQVKIKDEIKFSVCYRYTSKNIFKNYNIDEVTDLLRFYLGKDFLSGIINTAEHDYVIEYSKRKVPRLFVKSPSLTQANSTEHNRIKPRFVDANSKYLHLLGITNSSGEVHSNKYNKFRQIDKFIEIVDSLYRNSDLHEKDEIKILDLGSGKSYLTFAMYDYFINRAAKKTFVTGIELRKELVDLSNSIADGCMFTDLNFTVGSITNFPPGEQDIVVALHACDTATDDAILKAIESNAGIIILAPCCQKYVRNHFKIPENLNEIFKHGILEERLAVSVTDGLRALYLESKNYNTKVFEFISLEHTARNTMITAVKNHKGNDNTDSKKEEIRNIKKEFGLEDFYLDKSR